MFEDIRHTRLSSLALAAFVLLGAGCSAHYTTRGSPADLDFLVQDQEEKHAAADERAAGDLSLREILERRPTASFPVSIAVVRLQAPRDEWRSPWHRPDQPVAQHQFQVVTLRDVETDASLQRLRDLPQVHSIAGVNPLLVPKRLDSDVSLRKIAAQLRADVLLAYTLDTHEELDDESPVISLLTLGLLPTHEIEVRTTASAVLLDTRTGYCYGVAEGTASRDPHTSYWTWEENTEDARVANEREAFAKLVESFEETWTGVVAEFGNPIPTQ
jgi:hypothetical protein